MGTRLSHYAQYTEPVTADVVEGWRHCHCALIRGVHFAYEHDLVDEHELAELAEPATETETGS